VRSIIDRGRLPIIDTQATYVEGVTDVPRMIQRMNELDVAQIAFAAANAPTGAPSLDLHRRHPEYFVPTTNSGEFPRWWRDPLAFLAVVRRDLESGTYFFMGEHEFRHYPSPEQVRAGRTDRDITVDITGPAGRALFALSEELGVAFQIHYEIEDRLLQPLESMLERHPGAKVIWCHLAMIRYPERTKRYNPAYVSGLIERFRGLHFDLAVPPPHAIYKPSGARHSTLYRDGRLDDGWRKVIEAHPERFLSASDYRPPVADEYPGQISRQRTLILDALSEPARHLVAFGNAWRLITGAPWGA
jgi:Amidohydrolase